jgi:hypothetical protein
VSERYAVLHGQCDFGHHPDIFRLDRVVDDPVEGVKRVVDLSRNVDKLPVVLVELNEDDPDRVVALLYWNGPMEVFWTTGMAGTIKQIEHGIKKKGDWPEDDR